MRDCYVLLWLKHIVFFMHIIYQTHCTVLQWILNHAVYSPVFFLSWEAFGRVKKNKQSVVNHVESQHTEGNWLVHWLDLCVTSTLSHNKIKYVLLVMQWKNLIVMSAMANICDETTKIAIVTKWSYFKPTAWERVNLSSVSQAPLVTIHWLCANMVGSTLEGYFARQKPVMEMKLMVFLV